MRRLIFLLLVLISATTVPAQDATTPAPFGLTWLSSVENVQAAGVVLTKISGTDYGATYSATNLPKALSDLSSAYVSFGYHNRLFRIAAISKSFADDDYGTNVRARYDTLKASLGKNYKSGEVYETRTSDSYYGKPENFAYSLYKNKSYWFSMFSSEVVDVELSIGAEMSDTYWRIIYNHREARKEFENGKSVQETDAL